jgi:hypothetical protein
MKNKVSKTMLVLFFIFNGVQVAFSQITLKKLAQYIAEKKLSNTINGSCASEIIAFYEMTKYKTAWIEEKNKADRVILFDALKQSSSLGLNEKDYQYNFIETLTKSNTYL